MQKNTASQKFVVFAFNRTTNVPLTGDAANITANLQKDFGTSTATNDVNPTELEDGFYAFDATQAETNADALVVYPASSTADIQVIAVPGVIYTVSTGSPDEIVQTADNDIKLTTVAADVVNIDGAAMRGTDGVDTSTMRGTDGVDTSTMRGTDGVDTSTMRGTDSAATSAKQDTMETTLNAIPTTAMRGTDNAATSAKQDTMETTLNAIPTTAMRGTDNAATEAKQDIIDTNVDKIEVAVITNAAGVDISADVAAVKEDTGTNLPALIDDLAIKKNTAFSNFEFLMVLTSDGRTPATGLTVTGQRSIDGGAFASVAGTIAEVSNGIYQFDALAADTNGDVITWRFTSGTADDTFFTFKTVA